MGAELRNQFCGNKKMCSRIYNAAVDIPSVILIPSEVGCSYETMGSYINGRDLCHVGM
jgi:hypothetical protein